MTFIEKGNMPGQQQRAERQQTNEPQDTAEDVINQFYPALNSVLG
jgi:hypothetical protein